MRRGRRLAVGGLLGAALGLLLAPRPGTARAAAVARLRALVRGRRGAVAAFGGTPCAQEDRGGGGEPAAGGSPPPPR